MAVKTSRIDSAAFRALFTDELNYVRRLFEANNFELRIAGGAVRDLLMGLAPADVDFATTATPSQMVELFEREGVRMLHMRGEEHGTITCRIADKENFEITTLRVDLVCDGRRAEVAFTTDWALDAERRDLTINSLFLGLDGTVYDYFDGARDVARRRVAFVADPVRRIQEDYLRIFRYFRFFGRIAEPGAAHDAATLAAIADNVAGIRNVSGERIWAELRKLAVGPAAGPVLRTMIQDCGLGPEMGLPKDPDLAELDRVWALAEPHRAEWEAPTVLAALMRSQADVDVFRKRLKVSRLEQLLCQFVVQQRAATDWAAPTATKFVQDLFLDVERNSAKPENRAHVVQLLRYVGAAPSLVAHLADWTPPAFPVNGLALIAAGVRKGPDVRTAQDHLFRLWKEADYGLDAQQLLVHAGEVVSLNPNPPKMPKTQ